MKRRPFGAWLILARRRWCIWRGHEMASWSPIAMFFRDDRGHTVEIRSWRCAQHDRRPR